MTDFVVQPDTLQVGRIGETSNVFINYRADFSVAQNTIFDFRSSNQLAIFGIPKALFVDNSANSGDVVVTVSGTNQAFSVPARSQGVFPINAQDGSTVTLTSGATGATNSSVTLYNYERSPMVWYKGGVFPFGNVPVFGADTVGAPPAFSPVYMGVRNSAGNLIGLQLNAAGELPVIASITAAKNTGVVDAATLRFTVATNDPLTFAIQANTLAAATSLAIMDDWDEVNRCAVNVIPGQVGVAANSGAIDALTQRVTLGSPTVTDYSITNMTGASQNVVAAGNGRNIIFLQALATNAGNIWINLTGGAAVVGSGVMLAPGGTLSIQPGVSNLITGIAATANDDLTVYAG